MDIKRPISIIILFLSLCIHCNVALGASDKVDCSTLYGKVMCGYQGWFNTMGDGSGLGWTHWGRRGGDFEPGECTVDLWPDMSEYKVTYKSGFKHSDGTAAEVFSSYDEETVDLHFKWMKEYGIDGVFLQRFISGTGVPVKRAHKDKVLDNVRKAAAKHGRAYAMMYDLSGLKDGRYMKVVNDWKAIVDRTNLLKDEFYVHHKGKPVISLWGIGFADRSHYLFDDALKLIDFLRNDPKYGGLTIKFGIPPRWREFENHPLSNDAVAQDRLKEVALQADIISPWMVGRTKNLEDVGTHARLLWKPEIKIAEKQGVDYIPVVFPGFSWYNLKRGRHPINMIPRLKGEFMWQQITEAKKAGAKMLYVAMFDEVDEGTAIFKCSNNPPDGKGVNKFIDYEGLPSDHYLKLVHQGKRLIQDDMSLKEADWNKVFRKLIAE